VPERLQLPRLLTFHDVQALYRFGKGKTCLLITSGQLRAVKAGGQTLIPVEELERYVASLPPAELNFKSHGRLVSQTR
jgi:hypothetical protein